MKAVGIVAAIVVALIVVAYGLYRWAGHTASLVVEWFEGMEDIDESEED